LRGNLENWQLKWANREHTGFADEFTHVSEANARADGLSVSICAVLMAEACNIGLEPLIKHPIPALTRQPSPELGQAKLLAGRNACSG
jgi:hypothetical protein